MKMSIELLAATERTLRALEQLETTCRHLSSKASLPISALKNSTDVLRRLAISSQELHAKRTPNEASFHPLETPFETQPVSVKPWIAQNQTVSKPLRRKHPKTLK